MKSKFTWDYVEKSQDMLRKILNMFNMSFYQRQKVMSKSNEAFYVRWTKEKVRLSTIKSTFFF